MIGGGIHGVAVAREAALRGRSVLLAERGDLAGETSSRTSKLIHGGIRYLEHGRLGLVRESLRERAILLRTAPDFVRPVTFLLPTYRGDRRPRWMLHVGLWLYGALAGPDPLSAHRARTREEVRRAEPGLDATRLTGGFEFHDAQMDDALLCVATAIGAERAGAVVRTHTEVCALERFGDGWRARLRDRDGGVEEAVEARWIVNAAGPWADEVRAMARPGTPPAMRRTRGTHIVFAGALVRHALLLTARRDGRVFFALPWGGHTLLGTTDVDDGRDPRSVGPTREDVRYLFEEGTAALPALRGAGKPVRAFAGVRPLAGGPAPSGDPSATPRDHRLFIEERVVTIVGGKYTTHRRMAERVLDRIDGAAGGPGGQIGAPARRQEAPEMRLVHDRWRGIEELRHAHPERVDLPGGLGLSEAEAAFAVRVEKAKTLEDVLLRRTRLWLDGRALRQAAEPASRWLARWRAWGEARRGQEVARLAAALDAEARVIEEGTA